MECPFLIDGIFSSGQNGLTWISNYYIISDILANEVNVPFVTKLKSGNLLYSLLDEFNKLAHFNQHSGEVFFKCNKGG